MSHLFRQLRWLGAILAVFLVGCTPIELFKTDNTSDDPPVVEQPAEDPAPDPAPEPAPEPEPVPGEPTVSIDSSVLTVGEGSSNGLSVRLAAQPAADVDVTVKVIENDGSIELVGPATLTFSPGNWNEAQVVTFNALQDPNATDGIARVELTLVGMDPVHVTIIASDDEAPQGDGVALTLKDSSGYGATNHPVFAVIPLEYGNFQTTDRFRIKDADDKVIPAQFEVLNRWWARDKSIRHVVARFQGTVATDGTSTYFFDTSGGATVQPADAVTVQENGDTVTVDTGVLKFVVKGSAFNVIDEAWLDTNSDHTYQASERIVAPGASEGPVFTGRDNVIQRGKDRANIVIKVEERGPMQAVISIESLGTYARGDHQHGFKMRLYAYAGKSFVKVDYQLQNGAKNVKFSSPLYFEDVSYNLKPTLSSPKVRLSPKYDNVWEGSIGSGKHLFQKSLTEALVRDGSNATLKSGSVPAGSSSYGWADLSDQNRGMAVFIRHMVEMWPNGIDVASDSSVAVRLWPKWSAQREGAGLNSTGLYWLEDLQHVVKETMVYFHGANVSNEELESMAANLEYHPLVVVPLDQYRRTRATTDLGGHIPIAVATLPDGQFPTYAESGADVDPGNDHYKFGWADFTGETWRKTAGNAGGWPHGGNQFLATGVTREYWKMERFVWGDLNVRPMWMAGYTHDGDFATVQPTENPYGAWSWRAFDGHNTPDSDQPHIAGTARGPWMPRDNSHGWLYQIEDHYYVSANPWIRDWYLWMGEFRKRSLLRPANGGDEGLLFEWGQETRAEGHMYGNALQAYRVTGNKQLLEALKNRIDWFRANKWNPKYGMLDNQEEDASFQIGFLARNWMGFLREIQGYHPEDEAKLFSLMWGVMDHLYAYGRFAYYVKPGETGASSITSLSMVDPATLWYLNTGQKRIWDMTKDYVDGGLDGGDAPATDFGRWNGSWEGRLYEVELQSPRAAPNPPTAIDNLSATFSGGKVKVTFKTPARAKKFLLWWSAKPISRTYSPSDSTVNPWAGNPVGVTLEGVPGTTQSIEFGGVSSGKIHVIVVSRAANGDLSEVSNVVSVTVP